MDKTSISFESLQFFEMISVFLSWTISGLTFGPWD